MASADISTLAQPCRDTSSLASFFFLCSGQETVALFLSRRPLIATSRTCLVQVHDGQELMFGDVKVRKVQLNFFHC